MGRQLLFITFVLLTTAGLAFAEPATSDHGPADLRGVVDLAGNAANPLAVPAGRKATVLVFATSDCPISNRYAPEIQALAAQFQERGIGFTLVYPVATDTAAVVREHVKKFAYTMAAVRDTAQELVKHTGVKVTPEVAVIGAGGRVLYRGRIDDRYIEFGKDRQQPTERTLERALEAIVQGKAVAVRETQAVGCYLSDLVK